MSKPDTGQHIARNLTQFGIHFDSAVAQASFYKIISIL